MSENLSSDLLARLDERTIAIQAELINLRADMRARDEFMTKKIDSVEKELTDRLDKFEKDVDLKYVKKDSFTPIQKMIYGVVGLIIMTFIGALLSGVVSAPTH